MKSILCLFVITLPLFIYPVFLRVPKEITPVFGLIEVDIFSWYRMWLIAALGTLLLTMTSISIPKPFYLYWALLIVSSLFSGFIRTTIFGSPWNHEGVLVIVGYLGIYLAAKELGLFRGLERSIDISITAIFLIGIIQVTYGNFMGLLVPKLIYQVIKWPMYSTLGNQNNLGLFSALFFPYAYYRKKYVLLGMILFMLVCNESRGSWAATLLTAAIMGKKPLIYLTLIFLILSIPFYKDIKPRVVATIDSLHFPIKDQALSGRGYMWKKSIPILKKTLFLGNGPGTFGLYFPQKKERGDLVGFTGLIVDRPHNMFINIWQSTGLISLLLIIYWVSTVIVEGKDLGLVMGAFSFLVCGLTTDSVLSVTPYFIIFLGLISHERKYEDDEKRRDPRRARPINPGPRYEFVPCYGSVA